MRTITDENKRLRAAALKDVSIPLVAPTGLTEQEHDRQEAAILNGSFDEILEARTEELLEKFRHGETHTPQRPLSVRVLVTQKALREVVALGQMTKPEVRSFLQQYVGSDFKVTYLHVDYYGDGHSLTRPGEWYTQFILKIAV